MLEPLAAFEVVNSDANLVLDAHLLAEREQLSWLDALIASLKTVSPLASDL